MREMTIAGLLGLVLVPASRWIARKRLQMRIRSLQGLADYFAWQEANGRAGLADTQKRIALAKSDLHSL